MNATRATATMTTDGATFGITTETPPEDPCPPPRYLHCGRRAPPGETLLEIPRWVVIAIFHALLHVVIHMIR